MGKEEGVDYEPALQMSEKGTHTLLQKERLGVVVKTRSNWSGEPGHTRLGTKLTSNRVKQNKKVRAKL